MELGLTDDQEFLRTTTRAFLEGECPLATVRSLEADPAGFGPEYWKQGAALGWTSMLVPESDGGGTLSGEGLRDLVVVAEEMGRLVAPGPFVPCNVVASALGRSGHPDQRASLLPGILAGDLVAAWAHAEPGAQWDGEAIACNAEPSGDGFVLTGVKAPVEAGGQAAWLLVTARVGAGPAQFLVPSDAAGVTIRPLGSLDLVRRFAEVGLDGVEVPASAVVGGGDTAQAEIERQLRVAIVLQCAEACGAIDRVLEFTLDYVGDRYSFGRPLSSYQALKHRFADMKMWLEACHATTGAATVAVQRDAADAGELVSAAKSYVGSNATEIVQDCVQMHGGIGVTWEHDLHLYLRRVTVNRGMYGSPVEHRERIATALGMGPVSTG